ncbi:ECF-type transporter transmembrane protein EcfT (EcfT) [Fructobacillus fructosus]|uniref:energy-coupling factor transporter transmembrane component T family protein n=1 Tax=Fructobacillus fructosus TaxID=1631 RepID=UPI0002194E8C|nr:energy-coupling factor transporter transmembrane component T [Fructobacillus fructosus]KRN52116.1 ABC-type cobalt transport system, permease component CbiQ related transporter [Fructobacillus fructosus KCTC 3544]GAP01927.1 cobalt transport protein [Fructobacillus fructosus]CAK1239147.1 ECF-type transporter transmembrane protein EcfT (EcfT) [Fructobacillus fructosus]
MTDFLGYQDRDSVIHRLNATSKLLVFLLLTVAGILSFDIRFLLLLTVFAGFVLYLSKISWRSIRILVYLTVVFALLNLVLIYVFAPQYGVELYHDKTILLGSGYYALTSQQLFYELLVLLKYCFSVPLSLAFLLTTQPSQLAAGLNRVGISYKIAYAFSLTLRYLPTIQNEFQTTKKVQEARGFALGKKASLGKKMMASTRLLLSLAFSTLEKVETISEAMALRRFGKKRKRTWYYSQKWRLPDWLALTMGILLLLLAVWLVSIDGGRFWNPFR